MDEVWEEVACSATIWDAMAATDRRELVPGVGDKELFVGEVVAYAGVLEDVGTAAERF